MSDAHIVLGIFLVVALAAPDIVEISVAGLKLKPRQDLGESQDMTVIREQLRQIIPQFEQRIERSKKEGDADHEE